MKQVVPYTLKSRRKSRNDHCTANAFKSNNVCASTRNPINQPASHPARIKARKDYNSVCRKKRFDWRIFTRVCKYFLICIHSQSWTCHKYRLAYTPKWTGQGQASCQWPPREWMEGRTGHTHPIWSIMLTDRRRNSPPPEYLYPRVLKPVGRSSSSSSI